MNRWLIEVGFVVCLFLAFCPIKWYYDDQNLLEHPKGMAVIFIEDVSVDESAHAVFVNVSVSYAPYGVINFDYAAITDRNDNVKVRDDAFNATIAQGQSGVLRIDCDCPVLDKDVVWLADGYNRCGYFVTPDDLA